MSGYVYQSEIEAITNGDKGTKKQLRRKSKRTHLREDVASRRFMVGLLGYTQLYTRSVRYMYSSWVYTVHKYLDRYYPILGFT
jgi:hypothetical protein